MDLLTISFWFIFILSIGIITFAVSLVIYQGKHELPVNGVVVAKRHIEELQLSTIVGEMIASSYDPEKWRIFVRTTTAQNSKHAKYKDVYVDVDEETYEKIQVGTFLNVCPSQNTLLAYDNLRIVNVQEHL